MKFLLDTNFILIPAQFRVDVYSELSGFGKPELYTIDLVLKELEKLIHSRGKKSRQAKMALLRLKKEGVKILITGARQADAAIVKIASQKKFTVCTQDRALAKRLKAKKVPVVTLRQKRYLVMK